MATKLKLIEIENFKTYKNHVQIGPLKLFNGVIGQNGVGKSNFLDAVSFALGEDVIGLRAIELRDLIHGATINRQICESASVKIIFVVEEEENREIHFQRSVQGASSEQYSINGNIVSRIEYLDELNKLHINVKGKNIVVFQGTVESIVMKTPRGMTALFEEISGSSTLIEEYDELKKQLIKCDKVLIGLYEKQKRLSTEREKALLEKEKGEKFQRFTEKLNKKLLEYQLFRLYHNEIEINRIDSEITSKQVDIENLQEQNEKANNVLKEKKKSFGLFKRKLTQFEENIRKVNAEIEKRQLEYIEVSESVSLTEKNLENAIRTLEHAREAHENRLLNIRNLKEQLKEIKCAKTNYESQIVAESQKQGNQWQDEQVHEYHRLKKEATRKSTKFLQDLDSLKKEQKYDEDRLYNLINIKRVTEDDFKLKCQEKIDMEKRSEQLTELTRLLEHQKELKNSLQIKIDSALQEREIIRNLINDVSEQIADGQIDFQEKERRLKKREIVEIFKKISPDVYGRVSNLCQPIHKCYNVALTKVIGNYMDSIIVGTQATALQCVEYLKEHSLEPEIFLPLNFLKCGPIKQHLRDIKKPENVKLLYDVVKFDKAIAKAVHFITNNTLVCDTSEDAIKVAYELSERNDAVCLEGIYYQKNGMVSGGGSDLMRKAKRWDEKHSLELEKKRDELIDQLKDVEKELKNECELKTIDSKIDVLERKLEYFKNDTEKMAESIQALDREISEMSEQIARYGRQIKDIENEMKSREESIGHLQLKIEEIVNDVFSSFCQKIGVCSIREYEDPVIRVIDERKSKCLSFERQIAKINKNIEFEEGLNTENNITRWERIVKDEEKRLEICKNKEQKQKEALNKCLEKFEQLKEEKLNEERDAIDGSIAIAKNQVKEIKKKLKVFQNELESLKNELTTKNTERFAILEECMIEKIPIPLKRGTLDDCIKLRDPSQFDVSSDVSIAAQKVEKMSRLEINYEMLSANLKELTSESEINKIDRFLLRKIKNVRKQLENVQKPNVAVLQQLEKTQIQLKETNKQYDLKSEEYRKVQKAFNNIKQERCEKFNKCFNQVACEIDNIYKQITQDQSAEARLYLENIQEPYLDGIIYSCIPPAKSFLPISFLSGGEKALAAIALIFALQTYQPAPFIILDEVDAALDNENIKKLIAFIKMKSQSLQMIFISLREEFYSNVDYLIGVTLQPGVCPESVVAAVPLEKYPLEGT